MQDWIQWAMEMYEAMAANRDLAEMQDPNRFVARRSHPRKLH